MFRSFLFCLAVITAEFSHAQERILTDPLPHGTFVLNPENDFMVISTMSDEGVNRYYSKPGNTVALLQQTISGVKDSSFRYHGKIDKRILNEMRRLSQIGGVYNDRTITELYRHKARPSVFMIQTNLVTGETSVTDTVQFNINDILLNCTVSNGKVCFMTARIGTNLINIYTRDTGSLTIKKLRLMYDDGGKEIDLVFKGGNFALYNHNERYPALLTSVSQKGFVGNGHLILSFSEKNGFTYVARIDYENATAQVKRFVAVDGLKSSLKQNSSFVIDSLLITAVAAEKEIKLRAYSLKDGAMLYSKNINESNIDSLIVQPISRTGTFASKAEIKESKFEEFYGTVLRNELSVSGYIAKGRLFLNMASEFKQVTGPSILQTLLDVGSMAAVVASSNDYSTFYFNSYQQSRVATHTSLDITLSMSTFAPVKVSPNYGGWEKIATNLRTQAPGIRTKVVYQYMNNNHYAAYFNFMEGKYVVYRFNEKKDD